MNLDLLRAKQVCNPSSLPSDVEYRGQENSDMETVLRISWLLTLWGFAGNNPHFETQPQKN